MTEQVLESLPTCHVAHSLPDPETSQNGVTYTPGISRENSGSQRLCLHRLVLPPGARAKAHLHADHETAIFVLKGRAKMWYGQQLENELEVGAGDFLYIPANMPHLPVNTSLIEECEAIVARTDPNQQESLVLLPHLEKSVMIDKLNIITS